MQGTTFVNELKRIFDDLDCFADKKYAGRAFYGVINKDLRLKSDLIREFLNTIMPDLSENDSIEENYYNFLDEQRRKAIEDEAKKYGIDIDLLNDIVSEYEYSGVLDTGIIKEQIDKPLIEKNS